MNLRTRLTQLKMLLWRQSSYSQTGEDQIIAHLASAHKHHIESYLEIGGYHPVYLSNSYHFYKQGAKGVIVEPQGWQGIVYRFWRPRDTVLSKAMGTVKGKPLTYYEFNPTTLSTCDAAEAKRLQKNGVKLAGTYHVPAITPEEVLTTYFPTRAPDIMSLDIEGGEMEILKAWPWKKPNARPAYIILETLNFNTGEQATDMVDYLHKQGYHTAAFTHVNTILADSRLKRKNKK